MSPLLTRLIPQAPISRYRLGIAFGRETLSAIISHRSDKGLALRKTREYSLATPLFSGKPTATARSAITEALIKLGKELEDRYSIIQVALPDPAVVTQVFTLESLPNDSAAQRELAKWRFSREQHLQQEQIECSCQDLGAADGQRLLLAQAVDQSWLATLKQAFAAAGLLPAVIDSASGHRFNYFHDQITQADKHGAMISIESDYWGLTIWDDQGRLRFHRGRWRDATSTGLVQDIAGEAERSIRAWLHGGRDYQFGSLYLAGSDDACQQLATVLQDRMHAAPVMLDCAQGLMVNVGQTIPVIGSCSAMAAAVAR